MPFPGFLDPAHTQGHNFDRTRNLHKHPAVLVEIAKSLQPLQAGGGVHVATVQPTYSKLHADNEKFRRTCCQLQESDFSENRLPKQHIWIWDVAGMLMFCAWMVVLQYLQYSLAEAVNLRNINAAQYAVLLSNVGNVLCDERALEAYGRMYGDVSSTFYVRDFGRFLEKDAEVLSPLPAPGLGLPHFSFGHVKFDPIARPAHRK